MFLVTKKTYNNAIKKLEEALKNQQKEYEEKIEVIKLNAEEAMQQLNIETGLKQLAQEQNEKLTKSLENKEIEIKTLTGWKKRSDAAKINARNNRRREKYAIDKKIASLEKESASRLELLSRAKETIIELEKENKRLKNKPTIEDLKLEHLKCEKEKIVGGRKNVKNKEIQSN